MSCVCIYAPHLTGEDGLPSLLWVAGAVLSSGIWASAKTSACYNKRGNSWSVHLDWNDGSRQCQPPLLIHGVNEHHGSRSVCVKRHFFSLWSLSTTLWYTAVITTCEPVQYEWSCNYASQIYTHCNSFHVSAFLPWMNSFLIGFSFLNCLFVSS